MPFVLLLAFGAGATAVYGALVLAYKSVLFPDGRLEFHRLAGCRRTSVEVVRHVKHRKREGGGREFRIAFDGGTVVIVANEAGRRLVNTLTMRNRSIELVGYTRWDW